MNSRKLFALSLLALAPALPGCTTIARSGLSQGPARPVSGQAQVSQATAPAPAPESTPAPVQAGRTASYDGISFSYPSSLAQDVQVAKQEPSGAPDDPYWMKNPEYLQFKLLDYILSKTAQEPRIEVYPSAAYRQVNDQAGKVIDALKALQKSQSPEANQGLPFLPLENAKQAMHASVKFVQFQNGTGIRYLTQYNQGPLPPINNGQLFYTFQGLTTDGNYYVSAVMPVSNSVLPDDDQSLPTGDFVERIPTPGYYMDYLAGVAQKLDAASPDSFEPDLASLDAVIASLSVHAK